MKFVHSWIFVAGLSAMSVGQLRAAPIFGIESVDLGGGPGSQAPTTLYKFDSTGGVYSGQTTIGAVTMGASQIHADGLAYSGSQGLFAFQLNSSGQSRLVSINENNAQATAVGSYIAGDFRGAGFMYSMLLALDSAANRLVTVDTTTGGILSSVNLTLGRNPYNIGNSVDIAVKNNVVFLIEGGRTGSGAIATGNGVNGTNFYSADLSTGALTLLAQDLVNEAGASRVIGHGAAFEPGSALLNVSEMNTADGLFRYNTSNWSRTKLANELISATNSGRGDLASDSSPVPEPATMGLAGFALAAASYKLRSRRA